MKCNQVLLATHLHAGNVLRAEREPWLVIDAKGPPMDVRPGSGGPSRRLEQCRSGPRACNPRCVAAHGKGSESSDTVVRAGQPARQCGNEQAVSKGHSGRKSKSLRHPTAETVDLM